MSILGACAPQTVIEHQTINYVFEPEIYQHCQDEPSPPEDKATNGAWVEYTEGVRGAGQDCRDKVNGGREWSNARRQNTNADINPEIDQQDGLDKPADPDQTEKAWWQLW